MTSISIRELRQIIDAVEQEQNFGRPIGSKSAGSTETISLKERVMEEILEAICSGINERLAKKDRQGFLHNFPAGVSDGYEVLD